MDLLWLGTSWAGSKVCTMQLTLSQNMHTQNPDHERTSPEALLLAAKRRMRRWDLGI
jgi:hypothetical protein